MIDKGLWIFFMNLIKLESRDYKNRFFEIGTMAPRLNWARLSILSSDKFHLTSKLIKKTGIKKKIWEKP